MKSHPQFELDPTWFRRLFGVFTIAALTLIWVAYFASNYSIQRSLERGLVEKVQSSALVLEEHASRALDAVIARLKLAVSQTTRETAATSRISPEAVRELIFDSPMVRSLSLLNKEGEVLVSSEESNIGLILPLDKLPPLPAGDANEAVSFGEVFAVRDLKDLIAGRLQPDLSLWLISMTANVDGTHLRWVAAVNSGYFENFWSRVDPANAFEFGMFDYRGRRIFGHNNIVIEETFIEKALNTALLQKELGVIELGKDKRLKLAYRGSLSHPMVFAVIGDKQHSLQSEEAERRVRLLMAMLASVLALAVLWVIYRVYLRYEDSVAEIINQSRGISAHLMVSESDHEGRILAANQAFLERTGYDESQIIGQDHRMFNSGLHPQEFYAELWSTVKSGQIWKGLFRNKDRTGRHYWVNATIIPFKDPWGHVDRFVCFYSDITDAVKLSEELKGERGLRQRLAEVNAVLLTEANTDGLTGIANRRGFDQFVREAFETSRQMGFPISILMMDIDHFKRVNDDYGHASGDAVLKEVSKRWSEKIRKSDLLARLGGEEFCVVLPNTNQAQAHALADKLRRFTAAHPVVIGEAELPSMITVTVSVGVASTEGIGGPDIDHLIQAADKALYKAKHGGRNRVC